MSDRDVHPTSTTGWLPVAFAGIPAVALLLLATRSVLAHPVHYDELLHILAARGLLDGGAPTIADGLYERAQLYTRAVAAAFRIAGDSATTARLPALIGAAALVWLVASWTARRAGLVAGLLAGSLLALVPATIDVAVFARFYTFHAVVMTVMMLAVYAALQPDQPRSVRAGWIALAVLMVPLGWHFQETTVIALGAALAGAAALLLYDHRQAAAAAFRRHPLAISGTLLALALVGAIALWQLGLLRVFGRTAPWAARDAARFQYYLVEFRRDLPLLLPMLPFCIWAGVASATVRRVSLFAAVTVAAALLVHSLAAQKTMRYVYYVVPWMCVAWAVGITQAIAWMRERQHGRLLLATSFFAVMGLSVEGTRSLNLLSGRVGSLDSTPFGDEPDWTAAAPLLAAPAREAGRVVTSNSMKALYYLGRYDLELNATIVPETDRGAEFGIDERTGRRVISRPESVAQVLSQPGSTLVVLESGKIGRDSGVPQESFDVLRTRCDELPLPESTRLRAWRCQGRD